MEPLRNLFNKAVTSKKKPERIAGAASFATEVAKVGLPMAFSELSLNEMLNGALKVSGKKAAPQREGACYMIKEVAAICPSAGLLLIPNIAEVLNLVGDKSKPCAQAAEAAATAVLSACSSNTMGFVFPDLLKKVESFKGNAFRFERVTDFALSAPEQVASLLATALPLTAPHLNSMSDDVCASSKTALTNLANTCPNPDMEQFVPALVNAMADSESTADTVFKISSTTFVTEVMGPSLSMMAPILREGLLVKTTVATKRSCARIIENMCKLVDEPRYLQAFVAEIGPLLKICMTSVSDPECRNVVSQAYELLQHKIKNAVPLNFTMDIATKELNERLPALAANKSFAVVLNMVAQMTVMLHGVGHDEVKFWNSAINPVLMDLAGLTEDEATKVTGEVCSIAAASRAVKVEEEIDEGAEVLCDLPFGLAYGNKVLLRKTHLKLLRGHKYGLVGQNDCGKTSLLTSIADYKIEGFPSADELRTVFVATDIKTELADLTVLDYMFNDPLLRNVGIEKEAMEKMLNSMGFEEGKAATTTQKVGTLSGGWRMKLALSRAVLLNADILLLDEPTNHLDAYNLNWLMTYLNSLTDVTAIMVSHDAGLLTKVCTNMIEIDELKLHYYKGNLPAFMEARPEAKCYFELAEKGKIDFTFPKPGNLAGVKSKGKTIMKMTNNTFTYPGAAKAQLNNVTITLCLASRVACVGENGAGKSTMIKLLTGELEPDKGSGDVWKHPNCRVGYIAQHAFHHIEHHLEKTANEYIRWRYANGGDREEAVKVTNIATEEEQKMMAKPIKFPFEQEETGTILIRAHIVERLTERRRENKKKSTTEYEVELKGCENNYWADMEILEKNGFKKVLLKVDERIAIRAASFNRPLTKANVAKLLDEVGLAEEFSTHIPMQSLSGGQKVKVVLGSALWHSPHILILDEPTNYLDRESLGALARAIRKFEGGVVMITHNSQFCDNLCPVVWHLQNNTLDIKGDAEWMAEAAKEKIEVQKAPDVMIDKFGNEVAIKKKKRLTGKEKKLKKLRRARRIREGEGDYDSDEEI